MLWHLQAGSKYEESSSNLHFDIENKLDDCAILVVVVGNNCDEDDTIQDFL